jgi:hypothetical protein
MRRALKVSPYEITALAMLSEEKYAYVDNLASRIRVCGVATPVTIQEILAIQNLATAFGELARIMTFTFAMATEDAALRAELVAARWDAVDGVSRQD